MEHDEAIRLMVAEQYLLDELSPELRDEFEEHFFDCGECALDVRTGAMFIEQSKIVLAERPNEAHTLAPEPVRGGWLGWLRPAFAVPVMALLLAVVGYQNLVTYPQLQQAQVLPWASVNVGTYGSDGPVITTPPGKSFLLFVRIPPESGYSRYIAELYNPAGKLEWSLTIPATSAQDQWPVQVPGANRQSGTYSLAVHGVTNTGESKEVGRTTFELHVQQ